jgi:hypothetical protein
MSMAAISASLTLMAFLVDALVEQAFNFEAGPGRRGADQLDDRNAIGERAPHAGSA